MPAMNLFPHCCGIFPFGSGGVWLGQGQVVYTGHFNNYLLLYPEWNLSLQSKTAEAE
jgi:hypothetical protein